MRVNQFVSQSSNLSRRSADQAIADGRVEINGNLAKLGDQATESDLVTLDGKKLDLSAQKNLIMLNKPVGYVCSRKGQGNKTVYELLPSELRNLNCIGRLDKNSSGLLLFTNDGQLANQLSHPSYQKTKVYEVKLDKNLQPLHQQIISDHGINLEDGKSQLMLEKLTDTTSFRVTMHEGRNRQIRRTFAALGYNVISLNRTNFASYNLGDLRSGQFRQV